MRVGFVGATWKAVGAVCAPTTVEPLGCGAPAPNSGRYGQSGSRVRASTRACAAALPGGTGYHKCKRVARCGGARSWQLCARAAIYPPPDAAQASMRARVAALSWLVWLGVSAGAGAQVLPAGRTTLWNPGIPGGVPTRTTVCATVNASTYGSGAQDASAGIQAAINGCPAGQVVLLSA